ncbi:hypothetical protein F5883DRAFT_558838 [Diaporthe sp. PMI_573]|nr:hypothetical protein F5883DRAFT_558838 [Diaporthaceae sp. PMI_573]
MESGSRPTRVSGGSGFLAAMVIVSDGSGFLAAIVIESGSRPTSGPDGSGLRARIVTGGFSSRPTRVSDGSGFRAAMVIVSVGSSSRRTMVSLGSGSRAIITGGWARAALATAQSTAATTKCFIVPGLSGQKEIVLELQTQGNERVAIEGVIQLP